MLKTHRLIIALSIAVGLCGVAQAKEGGDQSANGAESWMAGAVPPPGNYFINYSGYYTGSLRGGNGDKVPGANVDAWFNAFRFLQVTNHKFLGGNYGWQVIAPVVNQRLELGGGTDTVTALGDITVSPYVMSWHQGNWHWVTGLDIFIPTGKYRAGEPRRSVGSNYWSFEPAFGVTYLNEQGWEASAKFAYNFKTTNTGYRDTPNSPSQDYRSGDEFHMDYLLGKHIGPWAVGVAGYYLQQTQNDTLDGQSLGSSPAWSAGRKGRVFAFGPSVSYSSKSGMQFVGQWQHETMVENRFGGDKFWLKLILPL